jgi:hypothetical protein
MNTPELDKRALRGLAGEVVAAIRPTPKLTTRRRALERLAMLEQVAA